MSKEEQGVTGEKLWLKWQSGKVILLPRSSFKEYFHWTGVFVCEGGIQKPITQILEVIYWRGKEEAVDQVVVSQDPF